MKKLSQMKKFNTMKKLAAFILALAMTVVMAGCGGGNQGNDDKADDGGKKEGGEKKELLVWTFLNPNDESGRGYVLGKAKELYESQHEGVTVRIESLEWDTMTAKFFAATQTGEAPDVIWVNGLNLGEAIQLGVVEPFENLFMKDWTDEQFQDLDDVRFEYGATDDAHYQLHLSTNVYGIVYRADLFKQFEIDPNFESWDDLIAAAQKLTYVNEDGMQVYGLGVGYSEKSADSNYLRAQLFTQYGDVVDENGQANWNGDVGQAALQMQIDMIDKYGITPQSAVSATSEEMYADFIAGKYAMVFGGSVRIPTIKSQCAYDPDSVKLMAYPSSNGKEGKGLAAGWNVCVYSGSEMKEEAGEFIETLCCPEIDKLWVEEGGQIPLLKSTVDACSEFLSSPDNEYLKTAMEMLENNAVAYNSEYVISGYVTDLVKAMQLAYVEGKSVEEALDTTAKEFNERNGN